MQARDAGDVATGDGATGSGSVQEEEGRVQYPTRYAPISRKLSDVTGDRDMRQSESSEERLFTERMSLSLCLSVSEMVGGCQVLCVIVCLR